MHYCNDNNNKYNLIVNVNNNNNLINLLEDFYK